jgi:hypothetical protein
MTPEQFAYWLQGFVELTNGQQSTPEQWQSVKDHLDTVFNKVTPEVNLNPARYCSPRRLCKSPIDDRNPLGMRAMR